MTQYAFFFDAASCSGCKACQVACKDRSGLEAGQLWRRVYEVSGGEWRQEGPAWVPQVWAYHLSVACNHCQDPTCLHACPSKAIHKRPDGVVLVDPKRCIGCRFCAWACPYGAPQYDPAARVMTKCDFCLDRVQVGQAPACVAACPLRSLDWGSLSGLAARPGVARSTYPLADPAIARPALLVAPHRDAAPFEAARGPDEEPPYTNREEIQPRPAASEQPLMLFTLLMSMAAGAFIAFEALRSILGMAFDPAQVRYLLDLFQSALAPIALVALGAAFWHLGRPWRAWRALSNLRRSWLSREVLFAALFAAASLLYPLYAGPPDQPPAWRPLLFAGGAAASAGLLWSMAHLYRLPHHAAWRSRSTVWALLTTSLRQGALLVGLGPALALSLQPRVREAADDLADPALLAEALMLAMMACVLGWVLERLLFTRGGAPTWLRPSRSRRWLLLLGSGLLPASLLVLPLAPGLAWPGLIAAAAFLLSLAADWIGRERFYAAAVQ